MQPNTMKKLSAVEPIYTVNENTGFKNFQPAGRDQRRIAADRHCLEKQRLSERKIGFQRHDPNPNPIYVPKSSAGYITEEERFFHDSAVAEKTVKEFEYQKKQKIFAKTREERAKREENRFVKMETEKANAEKAYEQKKVANQLNKSSVKYNLVTLKTGDSAAEKYAEDMWKYKGAVRANKLYFAQNSKFNPVTGEAIKTWIPVPDKPQPPAKSSSS